MDYWYADLTWGPGSARAPSKRSDRELYEAPPEWEVPVVDAPRIRDRVVFRGRGPVGSRSRPIPKGLAEVTSVTIGQGGTCVVGLRTVLKAVWDVARGEPSAPKVQAWVIATRNVDGRWRRLSLAEAQALFQLINRKSEGATLPAWFAVESLDDDALPQFDPDQCGDARTRRLRAVVARQGQADFRHALLDAYGGRCAMSDCAVDAVLEAAHIIAYDGPATNHVQNGLLLRADLHTLFDAGLISVEPETYLIVVDASIRSSEYGQHHGRRLRLPIAAEQRPSRRALHARIVSPST